MMVDGMQVMPATPPAMGAPKTDSMTPPKTDTTMPKTDTTPPKTGVPMSSGSLKFQVPDCTQLYVDGMLTKATGTERSFYTPTLQPGQKYYYEVRAELLVDGAKVTEETKVIVEAGSVVVTSFPKLVAAVNRKAEPVASK